MADVGRRIAELRIRHGMTQEKLDRFKGHKWYAFWKTLKQGYDFFEINRVPPAIAVCERRYVVNAVMTEPQRLDPNGRCPRFLQPTLQPFSPRPAEGQLASERITVPGPKPPDQNCAEQIYEG